MSTNIITEEEIAHYKESAFENQRGYKQSKFAFCKLTYPTLPTSIEYTRKVLCTAVSRVGKFEEKGDPRVEKLRKFLKEKESKNLDLEFLVAVCSRAPVRLGYSARLYDISSDESQLRDIKDMYLKENEIAIRTEIGSYDIVDAISSADAVPEYKQLFDRIKKNEGEKLIEEQEARGYYRELICWLDGKQVTVAEFNKLLEKVDPKTGYNLYNSESFTFSDKETKRPYEGEFTIETVYENGKENEAVYTFRSYDAKV